MNIPLLINLLVSDGWKAGIYSNVDSAGNDDRPESPAPKDGCILLAIRFVLLHSLSDMAEMQEKRQKNRMSRAVASSLPPTLSLLRRLISIKGSPEDSLSSTLAKMKELVFITNGPQEEDGTVAPRFNAAQFARALHLSIAKVSYEVWSNDCFHYAPAHVIFPWITFMSGCYYLFA